MFWSSTSSLRHPLRNIRHGVSNSRRLASQQATSRAGQRAKHVIATATAASLAAYTAGSLYPPQIAEFLSPRAAPPAPAADSLEGITYTEDLEDQLQKLPLLNELRHRQDASDWYETRPYAQYPEDKRVNSLTAGALRGPGKLALSPVVRAKNDESENYLFLHLGRGLCGHDGIVHGGLLATVLDEALGRIALLNLPGKIGVTASLTVNYRAPTRADQFVVIKTKVDSVAGRKITVSGRMEDLKGNLLVDAMGLFVEPKYAKLLSNSAVRDAVGKPKGTSGAADLEAGGRS